MATPSRLERFLKINKPCVRVNYGCKEIDGNVKKISIYIKDYKNKNIEEYKEKLSRKLEETYIDYSINFYKKNNKKLL